MNNRSLCRRAAALVAVLAVGATGACSAGSGTGASPVTGGSGPTGAATAVAGQTTDGPLDDQPGGLGAPATDGGGTAGGGGGDQVLPAGEDCVSYDPANITVSASGDAWVLRDGAHAMKLFDTQSDAEDARRVARNWTRLCFIGRGNTRLDRYRYIVNYFAAPSGLPLGPAPSTMECATYDPDELDIYQGPSEPADPAGGSWALYSGPIPLLFLASQADALRAQVVASGYTRLCVVGAGNDRPDPFRYRMTWWRQ